MLGDLESPSWPMGCAIPIHYDMRVRDQSKRWDEQNAIHNSSSLCPA
jgi:hypothetical protein